MSGIHVLCVGILAACLVLGYKRPGAAFTMAPIAALLVGYVAAVTDTPENGVLVPVLFIGTMIVVAATGWDRQRRQWFHWGAWYLLVGIMSMLLMGVALAGLGALAGGHIVGVVLIGAVVAFCVSLIHYGLTGYRRTAVNVISTISAVMRQNLPLPMALDCAAIGAESGTALVLQDIKTWLVKGCSLTEAIRRGYPACSAGALAMIAAGERIGQLPAALAAVETDVKSQTVGPKRPRPIHPFYPVLVVAVTIILLMGILTFVIPQFAAVLAEVAGGRLPAATRVLLAIVDTVTNDSYGVPIILVAIAAVLAHMMYRTARRRGKRRSVSLWLGDSLTWHLPVAHRFERDRSLIQTLELLRISLAAGCPVNDAIRGTLDLDVNRWFRRRLQCWLRSVERGENVSQAARGCGLGRALAWAFDSGVNGGSTPALLEMLESHYRALYGYRVNLTRYILWPVGILALGLMVGFVVYAIFAPAVATINFMALNVYP